MTRTFELAVLTFLLTDAAVLFAVTFRTGSIS